MERLIGRGQRTRSLQALLLAAATATCGDANSAPIAEPPTPPDSVVGTDVVSEDLGGLILADIRVTIPWQQGSVGKEGRPDAEMSVVRSVSVKTIANFDRVTIEFDTRDTGMGYTTLPPGGGPAGTEGATVLSTPRRCGSSLPPEAVSEHWILVTMAPAQAHDDAGNPLANPGAQMVNLENVRGTEILCDFEGVVDVAIPINRPGAYRVIDVKNPERLIIDVIH